MSRVAIIGHGYVGQGMRKIFPDAVVYDPMQGRHDHNGARSFAKLAIICVPTPMSPDGSCDTSIVEQAISELPVSVDYVMVKSTVTPGTTAGLSVKFQRNIVFSPEYMGEGKYWQPGHYPDPTNPVGHGFMILGGTPGNCSAVIDIVSPILGPNTRYRSMPSLSAELVKYFENGFLGIKVMYASMMREICEQAGADYHTVREGWLDDPRVGTSHSIAFAQQPGFGGKCLPKDISALRHYAKSLGLDPVLLSAMLEANKP